MLRGLDLQMVISPVLSFAASGKPVRRMYLHTSTYLSPENSGRQWGRIICKNYTIPVIVAGNGALICKNYTISAIVAGCTVAADCYVKWL